VIRVPELQRVEPDPAQIERTDIERSLAKLPRYERLALILYFYLDLPLDEVGAILGVSAAGAKTRVYRAAKRLRPGLEID
jgi:RNA polymerase sigma factor (sigma-70 family)